ncbi:RNA-directed DNA polymerase, eukaryota, reverse transcriptase zinc-binding domain protein [Tanacetum coccineum]
MDLNEDNKQGEAVIQQPPKEEVDNKVSNPDRKAEPSDLSRPPGFEFMKKSSSSSSKCSTSFARFRKKDIKGVSLIHELNQIIDVGSSLGYDVRVVERGKEENACGSKIFALNTIMARGLSGGLISMWDPNLFSKEAIWCDDSFIIIKGNWKNSVGDCYMVNIYGPQDQVSKLALWNRLQDFIHHHHGSYIMFGDMNAVRNEQERVGSIFNNTEADHFNSFIDATGLVDLPLGGRSFTWMNKADGFDDLIKSEWELLDSNNIGFPIKCHDKFHILKSKIRQWNNNNKSLDRNRKTAAIEELSSIENKIDADLTLIKDAFFQFYKDKFQAQDSQVLFPNLPHSHTLNTTDRDYLERLVTLEEIKEAVWDCGSSKAPGPDGFSFAFVKKYWDIIQKDMFNFINSLLFLHPYP